MVFKQRMTSLPRHRRTSYFHCQGRLRVTWVFKMVSFIWVQADVPYFKFWDPMPSQMMS